MAMAHQPHQLSKESESKTQDILIIITFKVTTSDVTDT